MIKVHQFAPAFGLPNASPFCMKLETYLRMAGLPYELVNDGNPMKAPKGKLPWIEDEGRVVADSGFIVEHLKRRHGDPLDARLTAGQRALATALQRLFEEHLYWAVVHTRWIDGAGWPLTRDAFFGMLPAPVRAFLPALARRAMRAEMRGHGMGRHAPDEIHALAGQDLQAVADLLADRPYLLGPEPASIDATAYAFLANILWAPIDSPIRRRALALPVLEDYCRRMKARYYA